MLLDLSDVYSNILVVLTCFWLRLHLLCFHSVSLLPQNHDEERAAFDSENVARIMFFAVLNNTLNIISLIAMSSYYML